MPNLKRILFGRVKFDAYEEYSEFQRHFLGILIFFNMVSSTSFLIANATGANRLPAPDILAIRIHLAVALVAFFLVRNIKRSYRVVWLFLLPPGFYLLLGRVGGEEFAIFLPDTDLDGALVLGETLRQAVSELEIPCGEAVLRITASIGVAFDGSRTLSVAEIQRRADEAMYAAKKQGRNRVCSLACNA